MTQKRDRPAGAATSVGAGNPCTSHTVRVTAFAEEVQSIPPIIRRHFTPQELGVGVPSSTDIDRRHDRRRAETDAVTEPHFGKEFQNG